ncbi:MAG: threonine synthase [Anaerolineae bacterium]|nr:threonine synthase [Anaerolineae bacterium]
MSSKLQCMDCQKEYPLNSVIYACTACGGLLDVQHDMTELKKRVSRQLFDARIGTFKAPYNSGVWRYKELIYPDVDENLIVSKPEGNTNLYHVPKLAQWAGLDTLYLKHEGENPTGSFKDRGMTGGVTHARVLGMNRVSCASTGNTSASLASYAATADMEGIIFFENKNIAIGKLSQAVAYGATCIQIDADFDRNLELVREVSIHLGIYALNSINPFRLEGQKSIIIETIHQLNWQVPDWIVVPGGNLGNTSAFGKSLYEMHQLGLIDKMPRIAVIQASGANPLYQSYQRGFDQLSPLKAKTIASAIKIGNPVNYPKAIRSLKWTNGVVEMVTDQEIMDAKALIDRAGIGCEPASACSLAGAKKLVDMGIIQPHETVVGILTGHVLKDPDATIKYHRDELADIRGNYPNQIHQVSADVDEIEAILNRETEKVMQP